jgi:TPR repeat protein
MSAPVMRAPGARGGLCGLLVLAAASAIAAPAMAAQWVEQPISPDLRAAMDKADAGHPAELLKLADGGRADAQHYAGVMLIFGRAKVAADPKRGCAYEEKASATRADAAYLVGECWRRGFAPGGLDKEKAKAAYTRAIGMGYSKAKCALGEMLFADPAQAQRGLTLCKETAEAGDADAQAEVGDIYFRGNGPVKADRAEARRWYAKAAEQKHPGAARQLGQMYAKGDGGKRDTKKAMELWKVADAAGDPMVAILVADQLFSDITGGKTPGPGKYGFRGGIPVGDIEVVEEWYGQARDRDPRPDVKKRAEYALSVLASFKKAAGAVTVTKKK